MSVLSTFVFVVMCVDYILGFPILDDKQIWPEQHGLSSSTTQSNTLKAWPKYQDNMYFLPRELRNGDKFDIEGIFDDNKSSFRIKLGTPENETAFDFQANFDTREISMEMVRDGNPTKITNKYNLSTDESFINSSFILSFVAIVGNDESHFLQLNIDNSEFDTINLLHSHEDINHIIVEGDVKVQKLSFSFA